MQFKEKSKAGYQNFANAIINDQQNTISFADATDSKLQTIEIPKINGLVRCDVCMSFDKWEYVDHDYSDSDSYIKEVKFRCTAWDDSGSTFGFIRRCDNDITIYLDENNTPIIPLKGNR